MVSPLQLVLVNTDFGVREHVMDSLELLGLKPDSAANKENATIITKPDSTIVGMVIPTNEGIND